MNKIKIVFATNNKNKLSEIRDLISDNIEILSLEDINCFDDLPENQLTLEGNALEKANYIFLKYGYNCFADDTGLEIDALNNEPGVFSARYAGLKCLAEDNINKVLSFKIISFHLPLSSEILVFNPVTASIAVLPIKMIIFGLIIEMCF